MKTQPKIRFCLLLACLAIGLVSQSARAFSLLGPVQPWMQASNGVISPWDIGGPMQITNEYRWNVPVVTYGFDKSFLAFFGTNGVAAVESAIQVLNDLPQASQIVLTNYPFNSEQINYAAQAEGLIDLKSQTLSLLLEHLGLTDPTRFIYVLYDWDPSFFGVPPSAINIEIVGMPIFYPDPEDLGYITNLVAGFNFDPETLEPSAVINNVLYGGIFYYSDGQTYIYSFAVGALSGGIYPVATYSVPGGFYTGLTYDDVGGLAYLLSTNNINYETLLPGVCGVGANANSFVNGAWRPGVDKITFVQVAVDPLTGEMFSPLTNYYTDHYITNGVLAQQQVARVITKPDFVFSVEDLDSNSATPDLSISYRTGTTNWINHAALNGNAAGAGPGVIQPPIKVIFNNLGRVLDSYVGLYGFSEEKAEDEFSWGTFDNSTNAPIVYPVPQTGSPQMTVRMWLTMGQSKNNYSLNPFQRKFEWSATSQAGTPYAFQTSTNLSDWVTIFDVTNNGAINTYLVNNPASIARFYRLIPQ